MKQKTNKRSDFFRMFSIFIKKKTNKRSNFYIYKKEYKQEIKFEDKQ